MPRKDTPFVTHYAAAAVSVGQPLRRVSYTVNGKAELGVQPCTAGQAAEAIALDTVAQGEPCRVKLWDNHGTFVVKVGKAIAVGADLYVAAGVFTDSSSGNGSIQAVAYEAAANANEFIEVGKR